MSLLVPNEGAPILLLEALLGGAYGTPDYRLDLYTNNYTPVPGSTATDFTIPVFPSYAQYTIDPAKWMTPTIVSNRAVSVYDAPGPVEWENDGSTVIIYGYFVRDFATGYVVWAEQFVAARTLNPGDELLLTLQFTGGTL